MHTIVVFLLQQDILIVLIPVPTQLRMMEGSAVPALDPTPQRQRVVEPTRAKKRLPQPALT
jgi:hypothetical protein